MTLLDFNGDGFADIAAGALGEDVGAEDAGSVNVLYGTGQGISATMTRTSSGTEDSPEVDGSVEPNDNFGRTLTAP